MARILGIDPGSRKMGFGVIESVGNKMIHIASGCIRIPISEMPDRLKYIFNEITLIIQKNQPSELAIETVFVNRNVSSALKLGQAQGAAICAGVMSELSVTEYSPAEIKKSIVGRGRAEKDQVQHMVKALLGLHRHKLDPDAADALAVAISHSHTRQTLKHFGAEYSVRRGRLM